MASHRNRSRRGATLVETAIVLPVFLLLVCGTIDLAAGVYRHNLLSELARRGAREAVVLGSQAPPQRQSLGPQSWTGSATDDHPIAAIVRPLLVGIDPAEVMLALEWPDGDNAPRHRVRCTVSLDFQGVTFALAGRSVTLRATSTLPIAN